MSHLQVLEAVLGFLLVYTVYKLAPYINWRWPGSASDSDEVDSPIISSVDMLGGGELQSMNRGTLAGFEYNLLTNEKGKVMLLITLPRTTDLHLIAIGSSSGVESRISYSVSHEWLVPLRLEGDFQHDFYMYVSSDKQLQAREIFTPDVMALFADYCRAYNFEIYQDIVYISVAEKAQYQHDTTTMVADAEKFLKRNNGIIARLS